MSEHRSSGGWGEVERVAAHYDDLDPFYREVWGEQLHHGIWRRGGESPAEAAAEMSRLVGDRLALRSGQELCDVGCGYGATARELSARFGVRVTGMTVSRRQADHAAQFPDKGVRVLHGDWLANKFSDSSFDAVLAVESLEHMPDPRRAIGEMERVLRPGGAAVLCCWLTTDGPRRWERRHLLEPICREGRLTGMARERDIRDWLRTAGLDVEGVDDLSREVEKTWPVCLRRTGVAALRSPRLRSFLLSRHEQNRVFAVTLLRIWIAYRLGAMRYLVFRTRRPAGSVPP